MKQIDDRGYSVLFANREIFRQLIISFVHLPWVKHLDFSKCELMKDSFVSRRYKRSFSDLVYKIKLHERDFYIVVLLEFKSQPRSFCRFADLGLYHRFLPPPS